MVELDLIDKKILVRLDRDSRRSNSSIAKELRISRERVDYRIKNLIKKGVIRKFPTIINPTKFGYSMFKLYFQFQNLEPKKHEELVKWLVSNSFVQWVTECKGSWDLNIIVFTEGPEHFNSLMQPFYDLFGEWIYSVHFNITLAVGNMEKEWILKEPRHISKIIYTANEQEDIGLDNDDLELLKIIANNSRISSVDISQKMKLTIRQVQYKIKQLEKKKVIKGYTVSLDYPLLKKQFYKVVFYMDVVTGSLKKKLVDYCRNKTNMPYFVFSIGEWPFEVEYVVEDVQEFYDSLEEIKRQFPQIKRHESILLSKEHKFDFMPLCYSA
jgi:DNA-binding Lrp family transcriptional regulator